MALAGLSGTEATEFAALMAMDVAEMTKEQKARYDELRKKGLSLRGAKGAKSAAFQAAIANRPSNAKALPQGWTMVERHSASGNIYKRCARRPRW